VAMVGDVDHQELVQQLNRVFMDFLPRPLPRPKSLYDEEIRESRSSVIQREGNLAYVMVGFLAPGLRSPDYPTATVIEAMLGGGKASRLFAALRETEGMGYELGTAYPPLAGQSHILGYVGTDPYRFNVEQFRMESLVNETKNKIVEQFMAIRDGKFSDEELRRAKRFAIGSYALRHQRMKDQSYFLGWYEAMGLGFGYDSVFPGKLEAVTREDVVRVARQYFGGYAVTALIPTD